MLILKVKTGFSIYINGNRVRYDLVDGKLIGPNLEDVFIKRLGKNRFGVDAPKEFKIENDREP